MSLYTYILLAFGVSLSTGLLMYLDSRLFDKPKTRMTYIKTIVMTNLIVFATVYLLMWLSPTKKLTDIIQSGGAEAKKIVGQNTSFVQQIGEEMIVGDAPF
jgi:hypothetical protein